VELHQKLVYLRKENKLTQKELSKKLGLTRSAYSQYELGTREPDFQILQKIADFYSVTTDFILGRSADTTNKMERILEEIVQETKVDLTIPGNKQMLIDLIHVVQNRRQF
jgi:transcriptional regulator with XRE-family HTH domain